MPKRLRVYRIFPRWDGGFSTKTADYRGAFYDVAAVSIRQAYYYAGRDVWAAGPDAPAGVLQMYRRDVGCVCWHDPSPHHKCASFSHGDGKQAITRAMKQAHGQADGREESAHNEPDQTQTCGLAPLAQGKTGKRQE